LKGHLTPFSFHVLETGISNIKHSRLFVTQIGIRLQFEKSLQVKRSVLEICNVGLCS
jgi:hypothetical protein